MGRKTIVSLICFFAWTIGLTGCSAVKKWEEFVESHPDIRPVREQRARDVAASYERRRDEMQMEAALASWQQGNPEGCRELLASLLKRNPNHREAQLLQIEIALVQENLVEAKQRSTALLEQLPDDAEVAHVAALVFDARGEEKLALANFRRAMELDPDNQVYAASYASVSESEAIADPGAASKPVIRRAATAKPISSKPRTSMQTAPKAAASSAVLLKSQLWLTFEDSAKARRLLEDLLNHQPQLAAAQEMLRESIDPRLRAASTECSSDLRRDWRWQDLAQTCWPFLATAEVTEPEVAQPDVADSVVYEEPQPPKKQVYFAREVEHEGPRHLDPALVTDDESLVSDATTTREKRSISAAVAALRQNRPELAIDLAEHGLEATPDSAGLYRTIATAEYSRGDYKAAREALEQCLALDNTHPLSYFLMGSTLKQLGQPDEAERHFLRARQLDSRYGQ